MVFGGNAGALGGMVNAVINKMPTEVYDSNENRLSAVGKECAVVRPKHPNSVDAKTENRWK